MSDSERTFPDYGHFALVKINRPAGDSSEGRICLDLSCGPGIITTRLASGLCGYEILVASDVSEAMTRRAAEQLDEGVDVCLGRSETRIVSESVWNMTIFIRNGYRYAYTKGTPVDAGVRLLKVC